MGTNENGAMDAMDAVNGTNVADSMGRQDATATAAAVEQAEQNGATLIQRASSLAQRTRTKPFAYLMLAFAIAFEVNGTVFLKLSEGFSLEQWPFIIIMLASYGLCFLCLTFALKVLPVGITYGIWGGAGTAAAAVVGVLCWQDPYGWQTVLGILCIMIGIALICREPKNKEADAD